MPQILPRVLESLTNEGAIICPRAKTPLTRTPDGLGSPLATWRVKNGALDLYAQYGEDRTVFDDNAFAGEVANALGFSEEHRLAVASAVADTALVAGDAEYTAEIVELAERLGIPREAPAIQRHEPDNLAADLAIINAYVGDNLPKGKRITRSVRIANLGKCAVTSEGPTPVHLSYHWLNSSANPVIFDGLRSPLPVPLGADGSMTVICDIETPAETGHYQLQFQAVVEGVRWVDGATLTAPVFISDEIPEMPFTRSSTDYSYADDHYVGFEMVSGYLGAASGEKRLLEVGGGIHPQASALARAGCEVVAIDISSPMCQLGQLYFEHVAKIDTMAFITCDAHQPPFVPGTFDGVLIFAALHHFSDPVRLLSNLRQVVKDGGFIAVMCEPCSPDRHAKEYLRDLEKGINEQVWTVEEYVEIFRLSGLRVQEGRIDGGSLKAILVSAPKPRCD